MLAVQGPVDDQLRLFASCSKQHDGGAVLVFTNFGSSSKRLKLSVATSAGASANASASAGANEARTRQEYHLTTGATDGSDLNSRQVRLNGEVLAVDSPLEGRQVDAAADLVVAGQSYGFAVVPGAGGGACGRWGGGGGWRDHAVCWRVRR